MDQEIDKESDAQPDCEWCKGKGLLVNDFGMREFCKKCEGTGYGD